YPTKPATAELRQAQAGGGAARLPARFGFGGASAAARPLTTTLPPAASTASIAAFDAPATSIVSAALSFPLANRRMPSPGRRNTPAATSLPASTAPSAVSLPASSACCSRHRLTTL